ncbi:MAG: DUF3472 domain-containing protein [Rikenellaceae bacterium]
MKLVKGIVYIVGLLSLLYSCSESETETTTKTITVSISPSAYVEVEAEGGEVAFEITPSESDAELKYSTSTTWVSAVEDKTTTWSVEANESTFSRTANIYIFEAETLSRIDTIKLVQKSTEGVIDDEPEYSFTEDEVPVFIPFEGNTYCRYPEGGSIISTTTGAFTSTWMNSAYITSSYFKVNTTGDLKIGVLASNAAGSGTVRFTVNDIDYDIYISGPVEKVYSITSIPITEPGYVRIDMQGIDRSTTYFADIQGFRIGGEPSTGDLTYVSAEDIAADGTTYWIMRGPSSHWFYTIPSASIEYFYGEVMVEEEDVVTNTYYMTCGFSNGYMGIQRLESGYRVMFSVWSPYSTDDPDEIPDEYEVVCLRRGSGVTVAEFGNEGSGGQSYSTYAWSPDTVYKCLVHVKPDNEGNTVYTGYFYADGEWNLIASFRRPFTNSYATGLYSFLENFNPTSTLSERKVSFMNQWVYLAAGRWQELTEAKFSHDNTARNNYRVDCEGYVDPETNAFVLHGFGFIDESTEYYTEFTREANGVAPVIDFTELENL